MRRIVTACAASLLIYIVLFAFVLDRPLTLGALRTRIETNLAQGAATAGPKLVILAGSNGPYSHRCAIIEPLIGRPCVNAGVAVGVGLDYLFARWQPLLHPGDIVYLPLEEAQYIRRRATAALGPDAAIMLRHDRATLAAMPFERQIAVLFAADLRGTIMSLIEMALAGNRFHDPREAMTGSTNARGDHVGHTAALGAANQAVLAATVPYHPTAEQIRAGHGTSQVRDFLRWANEHGVRVIGGLPTGFADSPIPPDSLAAIRAIYSEPQTDRDVPAGENRSPGSSWPGVSGPSIAAGAATDGPDTPGHDDGGTRSTIEQGFDFTVVSEMCASPGDKPGHDGKGAADVSRSDCGLLYRDGQAGFLELPNQSRFPRNAFFDTAEHLNEAAQIRHSVAVARALIHMAQRPADVADCRHCAWDGGVSDAGTH